MSLPQSYQIRLPLDIALDDVARVDTFESLVDFVAEYLVQTRRLYLPQRGHGVGKSFMLAAMARTFQGNQEGCDDHYSLPIFYHVMLKKWN